MLCDCGSSSSVVSSGSVFLGFVSIRCLSSWESSSLVSEVVCCVECVWFNCHCCAIIVSIVFQAYLHVVNFVRVRCYAQCPCAIMGRSCGWCFRVCFVFVLCGVGVFVLCVSSFLSYLYVVLSFPSYFFQFVLNSLSVVLRFRHFFRC